jgi:polysaccharide biosynthesis protein PslH
MSIVFVGGLVPFFNRQAVIYFVNNILPIIHNQIPEAKFYVIGYNPENKFTINNLNYKKGVEVVGSVDSIRQQLEKMAVFVSPILSGAGVKTKVIEALRFGKPVVATSRGVAGLWDQNAIIIQNEAKEFAKEVITLLQDDDYRLKKNYESRQSYLETYSCSVVSRQIKKIYTEKIIKCNS